MAKSTDRTKKAIGVAIRTLRKARGMSQADLAEALGTVGKATISSWETGRSAPDEDTLAAVAGILETPVDSFYSGEALSYHYFSYSPDAPDPDSDLGLLLRAYRGVNEEGKKYLRECALFAMGREAFRS